MIELLKDNSPPPKIDQRKAAGLSSYGFICPWTRDLEIFLDIKLTSSEETALFYILFASIKRTLGMLHRDW